MSNQLATIDGFLIISRTFMHLERHHVIIRQTSIGWNCLKCFLLYIKNSCRNVWGNQRAIYVILGRGQHGLVQSSWASYHSYLEEPPGYLSLYHNHALNQAAYSTTSDISKHCNLRVSCVEWLKNVPLFSSYEREGEGVVKNTIHISLFSALSTLLPFFFPLNFINLGQHLNLSMKITLYCWGIKSSDLGAI